MSDIISTNNLINVPAMFSASGYVTNAQWRRIDMNILAPNKPCKKCGGVIRYKDGKCVNCKLQRDKRYREANPEKVKNRKHLYRVSNLDKVKAGFLSWLERNRERKAETDRQWALSHPEKVYKAHLKWRAKEENRLKVIEHSHQWRRDNPEKAKAQHRKWIQENHEKSIAKTHRRRAKIRGNGGSYTDREWFDLLDKYGHKCLCCGKTGINLSVDHVIPLSKGGSNDIDNVQPLCLSCNIRKGAKTIDYRHNNGR